MTKKQNLYVELLKVKNENNDLRGQGEKNINIDEFINTYEFQRIADTRTVAYFEDELERAKKVQISLRKDAAKAAYFETEEGKAFKEQNESARKQLHEQILMLREDGFEHTRKVVKTLLGSDWDVITFGGSHMEIGIVESYREDGRAKGLFGHDFDVYFDKKLFIEKDGVKSEYRWELNYGAMGSFSIGEDEKRTAYLVGMAKFASDTAVIPALREYLHGLVKSIDLLQKQGYKLEEEFNNPPALAA